MLVSTCSKCYSNCRKHIFPIKAISDLDVFKLPQCIYNLHMIFVDKIVGEIELFLLKLHLECCDIPNIYKNNTQTLLLLQIIDKIYNRPSFTVLYLKK